MTKIQHTFGLSAALDEGQMIRMSGLYGTYGILKISLAPGGQDLVVEFDATRFTPDDVEAALGKAGLPLARRSV
jgi:hypothetical protein